MVLWRGDKPFSFAFTRHVGNGGQEIHETVLRITRTSKLNSQGTVQTSQDRKKNLLFDLDCPIISRKLRFDLRRRNWNY